MPEGVQFPEIPSLYSISNTSRSGYEISRLFTMMLIVLSFSSLLVAITKSSGLKPSALAFAVSTVLYPPSASAIRDMS